MTFKSAALPTKVLGAIALGLICLLPRVALWGSYAPDVWADTALYEALARQIHTLNFTGYLGIRTPGYPLFGLLIGGEHHAIWLVQSLCGLAISVMLYALAYRQTHSLPWSFLAGLTSSLSINLLFFEANLLTETFSTFLIVLSLLLLHRALHGRRAGRYFAAVGGVGALAVLTRPQLIILVPIYAVYCLGAWAANREPWAERQKRVVTMVVPFAILTVGWCLFNWRTVNYFGLTTLTGYYLTDQSGAYMELAPDKYATIRDIYLVYRAKELAETGSYTGAIHPAAAAMQAATGLSYTALSEELTRLSLELFIAHPDLYLRGVLRAWVDFWHVPIYWAPDQLTSARLRSVLSRAWTVERWLLIGANVVFLGMALITLFRALVMRRPSWPRFNSLILAVVLASSLAQAAVEYGENARYSIPFQPLVLYVICLGAFEWRTRAQSPAPRLSTAVDTEAPTPGTAG